MDLNGIKDWITRHKYLAIITGVALAVVIITFIIKIASSGVIADVTTGVFSDSGASIPLTNIAWGTLGPETTADKQIYVKNLGTVGMKLTIGQSNFNPAGANVLTLTSDYDNSVIAPQAVKPVKLTLHVPSVAVLAGLTNFSFDINLTSNAA